MSNEQLFDLMIEHENTKKWVASLPPNTYVMQLSTIGITNSLEVIKSLRLDTSINPHLIRVLLDFNQKQLHYRVKVLYIDSNSYSSLIQEIESLPAHLKVSKPYITSAKHILSKLESTQAQLKQDGIINVNP